MAYAIFLFKDLNTTGEQQAFTATWTGQSDLAATSSTVYLQVYNVTDAVWENLDSNNTAANGVDFTLSGTVSTNLSKYYRSGWVSCRVYQEKSVNLLTLKTDYYTASFSSSSLFHHC